MLSTTLTKCPRVILNSFLESTSNMKIIFQYIVSTALTKRPRVILSPFLENALKIPEPKQDLPTFGGGKKMGFFRFPLYSKIGKSECLGP